ncbi:endonuclease-reverse transcriptase [Elysia marginata]|uniref:Endonuclease-reverse transcriptase n=1 Tax=Elysia marginata TaxID=1093978 RepID=A0AAV4JED7_9GAST|nr:endonuclease-reverse transcriptase [Elysia marginata]
MNKLEKISNQTFERHENLDINAGELIAIPKQKNPKGPPKNLRPITLLNTIRKALSKIVLERITPHVSQYLSHSQSGFRPNRSTSNVAWTHKWLAAKVNIENIAIKIAGIDMSAAFDTINRETLLKILEDIVDEDEHRIIRFLLSNTIIDTKIIGATEKKFFFSNVGTPQGDSLSPVLSTIYLDHALKEVRPVVPKPSTPLEKVLPREIAYADDADFVAFQDIDIEEVGKVLEKYNLQVNVDKTEFTNLSRGETNWQTTKKVGTLIGDQEDIERRKQLSSAALVKLKNVWLKGDKITKTTKLKLYKALVKSVLTYNCGTWSLTQSQEERLNAFHRKHLKKVLNIKYPVKITNSSLYNKCNERPLSIFILESL